MVRKSVKPAKNLGSLFSMLANLFVKSKPRGATAERTYSSFSHGPCDASVIDFVLSDVQRFLESGELSDDSAALLRWNRSLVLWELGNFGQAVDDALLALPHYQRVDKKHAANIELSIKLMTEARPPLALLDYSSCL